jgi:hypothetical protein
MQRPPECRSRGNGYAQDQRENALQREKAALRRGQRALAGAAGLFGCVIVGSIVWYNQAFLREQYRWRMVMTPSVLAVDLETDMAAKVGSELKQRHGDGCRATIGPCRRPR